MISQPTPSRHLEWLIPLPLLLAACASTDTPINSMPSNAILCEAPRPQICTADYRPVCASLEDGSRRTYANGCSACGDAEVVSWVENACPE